MPIADGVVSTLQCTSTIHVPDKQHWMIADESAMKQSKKNDEDKETKRTEKSNQSEDSDESQYCLMMGNRIYIIFFPFLIPYTYHICVCYVNLTKKPKKNPHVCNGCLMLDATHMRDVVVKNNWKWNILSLT